MPLTLALDSPRQARLIDLPEYLIECGAIFLPLPQNLWVKTGIIALRSGARFLEVVHNRPIREWV